MVVMATDSSTSTRLLTGDQIISLIVTVVTILLAAVLGFLRWYCRARMRQQSTSSSVVVPPPVTSNALITFGPE